jgi:O-antigen/teichoic acid export membrane protein
LPQFNSEHGKQEIAMRSTFWRNLFWLGSSTFGIMAASAIYGLLVARYLGPLDFGRFALVVGIGGWLISIAQGGGTAALLLLTAQDQRRAGQLLLPGVIIQASIGIMAILVSLPVVWMLSRDASLLWPSILYGLANIAYLTISVPLSIYRGLDHMEWGIALSATGVGMVLLIGIVMIRNMGFNATIAANTVAQFLVLIIVFPLAYRGLNKYQMGWSPKLAARLWVNSIALWGVTIVQSLHWRVGLVAVQIMAGSYGLGIYTAAAKLVENLRAIPWFVLMAVLPAFARAGHADQNELGGLLQRAVRYILLIAFPLTIALVIFSPWIIGLFYTSDYGPSLRVFQIGVLGLVPLFIHWVFMNAMMSLHMERKLIATYLTSILMESVLDIWLIPTWGASGAAVGYVIGESVAALCSGLCVIQVIGHLDWNALSKIALVGTLALALARILPFGLSPLVWGVAVCLVYLAGIFSLRTITFSELRGIVRRAA